MSRFQMIKRLYCTPIGNYSFPITRVSKKHKESDSLRNQRKDKNIIKIKVKDTTTHGDSYKGLWGCGVVKGRTNDS